MRVMLLLLLALAIGAGVHASFAASVGFSGRNADCTVCHTPPAPSAATAILEGAPEQWDVGRTYTLDIRVEGGPDSLLPGRPQGGFELEIQEGSVSPGAGMDDLLRTPRGHVITYEPAGTMRRDWQVSWTAPDLTTMPQDLTIWLAVVAANGDHDAELNQSDGGERGDAVATTSVTVPPHPDVVSAWQAMPLRPPVIDARIATDGGWRVEGHQQDANATHLVISTAGVSQRVAADGPWVLELDENADVDLHAEGAGRTSPTIQALPGNRSIAAPLALLPLLGVGLWRRP